MSHLIKNDPCLIPEDSPFLNDQLKREWPATYLTSLISTLKQPFVLSINSPWGTGKTTFLTMWRAYLKSQGYHSIYLNSWENDYSKTPFVSFVGEIKEYMNNCVLHKKSPKYLINRVKGVAEKGAVIAPQLVGKAAAWFTSSQDMDEVGGVAEAVTANLIDGYLGTKAGVKGFKNELEELVQALQRNRQKLPLVFFIDELDRCRPDYAIELLETAKHLFDVTGIVFVIAVDRDQLAHTVKHLYGGSEMDADGYLRRFIDLEYSLANEDVGKFVEHLFRYVYKLGDYLESRGIKSKEIEAFLQAITRHSELFKLRLRDIEKVFVRLNLVTRLYPATHHFFHVPVSFYTFLREADSPAYLELKDEQKRADALKKYMGSWTIHAKPDENLDWCDIRACETLERSGKVTELMRRVSESARLLKSQRQSQGNLDIQAGIYEEYHHHGFLGEKTVRRIILELIDLSERFA